MKSVGVLKLIAAAIFGGLIGCVATGIGQERGDNGRPPVNGGDSKYPSFDDVVFKSIDGRLIPHRKDGTPYVLCERDRQDGCPLYKKDITITELKTVSILQVKSTASPECPTIEITNNGAVYRFTDPLCKKK